MLTAFKMYHPEKNGGCLEMCCDLCISFVDVYGWPEGTFGLPMPKTGCPVGAVVDWETGKLNVKPVLA